MTTCHESFADQNLHLLLFITLFKNSASEQIDLNTELNINKSMMYQYYSCIDEFNFIYMIQPSMSVTVFLRKTHEYGNAVIISNL